MTFAFVPDGLPRLFRFVEPGTLPGANLLTIYDATKNLLIIDKALYATLSKDQQRAVLRSHESAIEIAVASPPIAPT